MAFIKWTWILFSSIIFLIVIGLGTMMFKKSDGTFTNMKNDLVPQDRWLNNMSVDETKKYESRGEKISRDCLSNIYGMEFKNIRLNEIKNSNTGKKLEIDCYNDKLKIGLEYHGINHYRFIPFFHKTRQAFEESIVRDNYKLEMCKKLGITLIVVPYTTSHDKICSFVNRELDKFKKLDHIKGWNDTNK